MNVPASNLHYTVPKTPVLGLGSPNLTDNGVGIHMVRTVAARCVPADGVTFADDPWPLACFPPLRLDARPVAARRARPGTTAELETARRRILPLLAVEVEEVHTFGESCTPAVTATIPGVVEAVLAELRERP